MVLRPKYKKGRNTKAPNSDFWAPKQFSAGTPDLLFTFSLRLLPQDACDQIVL